MSNLERRACRAQRAQPVHACSLATSSSHHTAPAPSTRAHVWLCACMHACVCMRACICLRRRRHRPRIRHPRHAPVPAHAHAWETVPGTTSCTPVTCYATGHAVGCTNAGRRRMRAWRSGDGAYATASAMAMATRLRRDWARSAGGGPAVGNDDAIEAGVKGLGGKLALQLSGTASLDAPSQIWPVPLRLLSLDVAAEVCCDAGAMCVGWCRGRY